LPIAQTSSQ